jgi:hypothetical protein
MSIIIHGLYHCHSFILMCIICLIVFFTLCMCIGQKVSVHDLKSRSHRTLEHPTQSPVKEPSDYPLFSVGSKHLGGCMGLFTDDGRRGAHVCERMAVT